MELIKRLKERSPEYPTVYENLISIFTMTQGGRAGSSSDSSAWAQGKYFTTKYEIFMYAAFLGIKRKYRLPLTNNEKNISFWEIKNWQPVELVNYLIMSILTVSDIDFNQLEELNDDEVEKKITDLKKILEEYANGGFDIIRAKYEEDSTYFENNDNCFLDLLSNL